MKVLFVGLGRSHFKCYESIIRNLIATGHEVNFVLRKDPKDTKPASELDKFVAEFPNIPVEYLVGDSVSPTLELLAALRTVSCYLRLSNNSPFYLNRRIPRPIRTSPSWPLLRRLLKINLVAKLLGIVVERMIPTNEAIAYIKKVSPDVVIASPANGKLLFEAIFLKAAQRLGIKTAVSVLSWDNLSTKSMFQTTPDTLLVWNHAHIQDAMQFHQLPMSKLAVIGSPYFDCWFDTKWQELSYSGFCDQVGLDSNKPFILYLVSSANIAKDETWSIEEIANEIKKKSAAGLLKDMQILVRPHPENFVNVARLVGMENIAVYPKPGIPQDKKLDMMYYSLKYARAVVAINTTAMLESMIFDTPVITVMHGQYRDTQEDALHFKHLVNSEAMYIVENAGEVPDILQKLENGDDPKRLLREKFVKDYIRPYGKDVSAATSAVKVIEKLCPH